VYDEMILDGQNQLRVCLELGILCPTRDYEGDDPVGFVVSMNLLRQHRRRRYGGRGPVMEAGRQEHPGSCSDYTKSLTLHPRLTYYTRTPSCALDLGAAGATAGLARQLWPATLASPLSTRRMLMVPFIIAYFHRRVCIFFCVRTSHGCCLEHTWIVCIKARSLAMSFIKDTYNHIRLCAPICPLTCFLYHRAPLHTLI